MKLNYGLICFKYNLHSQFNITTCDSGDGYCIETKILNGKNVVYEGGCGSICEVNMNRGCCQTDYCNRKILLRFFENKPNNGIQLISSKITSLSISFIVYLSLCAR
ncbi:hypothetical protein SNEBB_009769 [Seison nebaliae]|nr:hypothetical protein SNEBB_009769 [Seison nebaliae]